MVCDDDPVTLKVLSATLEHAGYTVSSFGNAEDAEKAIATTPFGAMIIDLNLPGINGVKLIDEIRWGEVNGNTRIMVYSGRTGLRDISLCFRQGANAYVAKPCDGKTLLEVLTRMLDGEDRMVRLADDEVKPGTSRLEVRRYERYPAQPSVARLRREIDCSARHSATIEDYSVEGVKLTTKEKFCLGDRVYLRCQLFQPFEFEVPYEVVNVDEVRSGEYSIGLRLGGNREALRERLQRII